MLTSVANGLRLKEHEFKKPQRSGNKNGGPCCAAAAVGNNYNSVDTGELPNSCAEQCHRISSEQMTPQLYIATNGLGMWMSDDLGTTLVRIGCRAGMYSGYQIWALATDSSDENVLFAA